MSVHEYMLFLYYFAYFGRLIKTYCSPPCREDNKAFDFYAMVHAWLYILIHRPKVVEMEQVRYIESKVIS